jgi:Tfp pilus assembly protein FimT
LVLTDADSKIVEMNVGSANNLTVPLNSSVAFPIGTQIPIVQYGAGVTTIVATGGVTINSTSASLVAPAQYAPMVLEKRGTNEWYLWGTGSDNISATTITSTISTEFTNVVQSSGDITHKTFKTRWIDAAGTSITQDRNILNGYTDATATVIFTVVGVKSDGSESTGAQYAATFNKDGGTTVVEVGAETQIYMHESDAGTSVTISVASNLIRVVVDSGDADSYQWTVFADVTITEL